ncbi:MAG: ArsR family transcriptional regulator [Archaeoglobales archaeon]|nr:ArsR family transcriptional regulator [Archaeoglobales archaeon]
MSALEARRLFETNVDVTVLKVLSRSGVSSIVFCLERSPKRFSEIMFETRLNPGILDRHLKALAKLEIVEKSEDFYQLTKKGLEVAEVLQRLFSIV